jgi:hypothetical protein
MSGKNITYRVKKRLYSASQESLLENDDFDCVNPEGPVDNSSCSDEDSLCECPCVNEGEGITFASPIPLFREPTNKEIAWAETVANEKSFVEQNVANPETFEFYLGCVPSDNNSLMNTSCPCHGKHFYSYLKSSNTYSTFWETDKRTPILRNALLNLYSAQTANCIIPGNLEVKIGDFLVLPNDGTPLGNRYSGSWLISRIEHRIASLQNYKMILTLIRDNRIPDPDEEG